MSDENAKRQNHKRPSTFRPQGLEWQVLVAAVAKRRFQVVKLDPSFWADSNFLPPAAKPTEVNNYWTSKKSDNIYIYGFATA